MRTWVPLLSLTLTLVGTVLSIPSWPENANVIYQTLVNPPTVSGVLIGSGVTLLLIWSWATRARLFNVIRPISHRIAGLPIVWTIQEGPSEDQGMRTKKVRLWPGRSKTVELRLALQEDDYVVIIEVPDPYRLILDSDPTTWVETLRDDSVVYTIPSILASSESGGVIRFKATLEQVERV